MTTLRPYLMVAPAMVIFGLFILYPIFYMIYLSFFDWNLIGEKKFIGVKNYTHMFADADFWQVLGNSVYYMVMVVILQMALSLLLAVYLNKNTRINRILQSIAFTPYITSMVSVAFIWMWMMDSDYGPAQLFPEPLSYSCGRMAVRSEGGDDITGSCFGLERTWLQHHHPDLSDAGGSRLSLRSGFAG